MTDVELAQIAALAKCKFSPGSAPKAFVKRLASYAETDADALAGTIVADSVNVRRYTNARELSDKERVFLDKLAHQYRKQIGTCMSVACVACMPPVDPIISVALDMVIMQRPEIDEFAKQLPVWRKAALARYNEKHNERFSHPYEYVTACAPQSRCAKTLGEIFCRFCGEKLFHQVKQPHKLVADSADAQRHLTACALQLLAGMRDAAPVRHRTLPMEAWW